MANKMFGNALRELRKKKGYTQQQAANLLGLKNKSTLVDLCQYIGHKKLNFFMQPE